MCRARQSSCRAHFYAEQIPATAPLSPPTCSGLMLSSCGSAVSLGVDTGTTAPGRIWRMRVSDCAAVNACRHMVYELTSTRNQPPPMPPPPPRSTHTHAHPGLPSPAHADAPHPTPAQDLPLPTCHDAARVAKLVQPLVHQLLRGREVQVVRSGRGGAWAGPTRHRAAAACDKWQTTQGRNCWGGQACAAVWHHGSKLPSSETDAALQDSSPPPCPALCRPHSRRVESADRLL